MRTLGFTAIRDQPGRSSVTVLKDVDAGRKISMRRLFDPHVILRLGSPVQAHVSVAAQPALPLMLNTDSAETRCFIDNRFVFVQVQGQTFDARAVQIAT